MNSRLFRVIIVFVFSTLGFVDLQAGPLDVWHWRNPTSTGNVLYGVCFGDGKYVAVGERGAILVSPDTINWFDQRSDTSVELHDVAFGNGLFVAVGEFGAIFYSNDGMNWTRAFTTLFYHLNGITFGQGQFIAVGENGTVVTSADGFSWWQRASGAFDLNDIAFGNNRFVAVGNAGVENVALVSTDGTNWLSEPTAVLGPLKAVSFGNGKFVTAAASAPYNYTATFQTSADGFVWTLTQLSNVAAVNAISYGDGKFVAFPGGDAIAYSIYLESVDGVVWNKRGIGTEMYPVINGVAFGEEGFVAVGGSTRNFEPFSIFSQPRGSELWREQPKALDWAPSTIKFLKDRYFSFGNYYSQNQFATSESGVNWQTFFGPANAIFSDLTTDGEKYLAVGDSNILVSTDAEHWTIVATQTNASLRAVAWGDNRFVAVGSNIAGTSTDGTNWNFVEIPDADLSQITFGLGKFIALTLYGLGQNPMLSTTDGTSWTAYTNAPLLKNVTFADGRLVATASDNRILDSTNAIDWWVIREITNDPIVSATRVSGTTVALVNYYYYDGDNSYWIVRLISSINESSWTVHDPGSARAIFGMVGAENKILLLGFGGILLQSDPITPEPPQILYPASSSAATPGTTVTLRPVVSGSSPISFQWFRNGNAITGATNEYLTFHNSQVDDSDEYSLFMSNAIGETNSEPARFTVGDTPQLKFMTDPRLSIVLSGTPNCQYRIECVSDLSSKPWQTWTNLTLVAPSQTVQLENQPAGLFFRAQLLP